MPTANSHPRTYMQQMPAGPVAERRKYVRLVLLGAALFLLLGLCFGCAKRPAASGIRAGRFTQETQEPRHHRL